MAHRCKVCRNPFWWHIQYTRFCIGKWLITMNDWSQVFLEFSTLLILFDMWRWITSSMKLDILLALCAHGSSNFQFKTSIQQERWVNICTIPEYDLEHEETWEIFGLSCHPLTSFMSWDFSLKAPLRYAISDIFQGGLYPLPKFWIRKPKQVSLLCQKH